MTRILVFVLHHEGALHPSSLGAVSEAARVAGVLGGEAHAVVVGDPAELGDELCAVIGRHGAARVFRVPGQAGLAQPVVDAMDHLIARHGHAYALFGGGLIGFEAGAALAARRRAGIAADVTAIRPVAGALVAERPVLGDSQIATVRFNSPLGVIVSRANAFEADPQAGSDVEAEDVAVEPRQHSRGVRIVSRGERRGSEAGVEDADVVVAGGRGLGGPEGFELVERLAAALGGAVGATRAVVDLGWYPYSAQVGQTGKTVRPRLYVAAGVSGAIQHKVGMQHSEHIVAINRDPRAPIFSFSHLGVVGDLHAILPRLVAALEERLRAAPAAAADATVDEA